MSASFISKASRQSHFSKPADTNVATLYSASGQGISATLEGLNICASSACAVSVWISNGVTDYLQLDAYSMNANTHYEHDFGEPVLRNGWALKVKTSVGNAATFSAVIAEEYGDPVDGVGR